MDGQNAITTKALNHEVASPICEKAAYVPDRRDSDVEVQVCRGTGVGVHEQEPFPDGGLRAWLVVFGAFWTVFCGFGICGAVGGFQSLYRETLLSDYTESQVAWITSAQAFFTFAPSLVTGALFDKYGHKPLVATGGFLLTLGFCMLSLSSEYYQIFLCHVFLIAGGTNLLFLSPLAVVGQWFDKRRGIAFGITSCGSSAGAATWPVVLANLPPKVGFPWTCRIMALITLFCAITAFFLLKTRLPPKPKGAFFYLGAFRSTEYCLIVVTFAAFSWGYYVFQTYIGTYGSAYGLGSVTPYLLIITNGASGGGRLTSGIIADRWGIYNTVIVGNTIVAALYWIWLGCRDTASCIALSALIGASGGAFITLQAPLTTKTAPNMNLGGTMLGQALFVQSFVMLVSTPISGALLGKGTREELRPRFIGPICLCATMMTIALVSCTLARLKRSTKLATKI